jgi:hypothetical protein
MTIPGENIMLDTNDRIGFGVYADIFRPCEGGLVHKLFIGFRHGTTVSQGLTDPKDDHRRRKTFDSECRAPFVLAPRNCRRDRIPRKRRRQLPAPLLLWHGIYRRRGRQTRAVEQRAHIKEAQSAFHRAGIAHTTDASVFFAEDPHKFKFIDGLGYTDSSKAIFPQ